MVDVGVGKVPLGAAKPPSRRDGGIGPTGPPFNRMEELIVPCPGPYELLRSLALCWADGVDDRPQGHVS